VPAEAGFFLVAWIVDVLTDDRVPARLREAEARLEAIRDRRQRTTGHPSSERRGSAATTPGTLSTRRL
jgi:hypothetical protein